MFPLIALIVSVSVLFFLTLEQAGILNWHYLGDQYRRNKWRSLWKLSTLVMKISIHVLVYFAVDQYAGGLIKSVRIEWLVFSQLATFCIHWIFYNFAINILWRGAPFYVDTSGKINPFIVSIIGKKGFWILGGIFWVFTFFIGIGYLNRWYDGLLGGILITGVAIFIPYFIRKIMVLRGGYPYD